MENQLLTAKEVADDFFAGKVSYQKVLRLTRHGILPAMKLGKESLYSRDALKQWVKQNFTALPPAR